MTQKKQTNRIWAFVNLGRQTIIDGDSASFYNCMEDLRKQLAVTKQEFQQFQSAFSTQLGNLQQIFNNISDFTQKKKLVDKFDGMIQLLLEQYNEIQALTQQISNINVQSMLDEVLDVATQVKEEIKDKKNLKKQQTNLRNAAQKTHPNKEEILRYADFVLNQSPDDFFAKFCQALYSKNYRDTIDFIDKIDVEHLEKNVLKDTICFLIKLMRREWITPASGFIERASFVLEDNEGSFRAAYRTPFEQKKKQIDENVYGIPTEPFVFVAYNSDNVVQVSELVTFLEETPGIKCFVAFRNVENGLYNGEYIDKLHKAMDNCSIFVLYSTYKSRNEGGSLEEMEYIMNEDYHRATLAGKPKYDAQRVYSNLPDDYKKPRVEFVRETRQLNERDTIADKFFGTTTRRTDREELRKRILELLQNENRDDASTPEQSVKKACKPTGDTHKPTPKHSEPIVDQKNNETTQNKPDINSYGEQKKESEHNKVKRPVVLRSILESDEFKKGKGNLVFAIGQEITGKSVVADLSDMPHLLVAGTTGSGKSMVLNCLIVSLMYKYGPEYLRFMMVDPKIVELSRYNGIPHMLTSTITVLADALAAMDYLINEMEARYQLFRQNNVGNISEYNSRINPRVTNRLPYLVFIVDEFADLMAASKQAFESKLQRLAPKSRAAGIHIVLATQRPDVKTITGTIKANLPCRMALKVSSPYDSSTIINCGGAEKLLGKGDMLFMSPGSAALERVQGAFVSNDEIRSLVDFMRDSNIADFDEKISKEIFVSERQAAEEAQEQAAAKLTTPQIKHTITFIADGKKIDTLAFVEGDMSVREPSIPLKVGYSGKWCSYTLGSHDLIVQAVYTPIRYTITYFNINGATNPNPTNYTVSDLPLDIKPLAKDGYSFVGWYVDEAMTKGIARLTEAGEQILYAKWIKRVEPLHEPNRETDIPVIGFTSDAEAKEYLSFTLNADGKSYAVGELRKNVEKLIIPEKYRGLPITSIRYNAFRYCKSLKEITIPSGVTSIDNNAFSYCGNLVSIRVQSGNTKYHSAGNCVIETETKTLIVGCNTSIIPRDGSVTSIGSNAFYGSNLTSITIPSGVTNIGKGAFCDCSSLISIPISSSVTSIEDYAFKDCRSLPSITIPKDVTSIEDWAFYDCRSLKEITIPSHVTSIGKDAFCSCKNLQTVTFERDSKLQSIRSGAFACTGLQEITIPSSVIYIGENVFWGCKNLQTVYYSGNKAQWKKIRTKRYNFKLNVDFYYYSEERPKDRKLFGDKYWHWDETKTHPVIWQ